VQGDLRWRKTQRDGPARTARHYSWKKNGRRKVRARARARQSFPFHTQEYVPLNWVMDQNLQQGWKSPHQELRANRPQDFVGLGNVVIRQAGVRDWRNLLAAWYLQPGILLQVFSLHLSTTRPCLTKEDSQAPCKVRPISYTLRPVTTFRILHKPSEVFAMPIQNLGRPSEVSLLRPRISKLPTQSKETRSTFCATDFSNISHSKWLIHYPRHLTTYLRHLEFDTRRS